MGVRFPASSLTSIASMLAPTGGSAVESEQQPHPPLIPDPALVRLAAVDETISGIQRNGGVVVGIHRQFQPLISGHAWARHPGQRLQAGLAITFALSALVDLQRAVWRCVRRPRPAAPVGV